MSNNPNRPTSKFNPDTMSLSDVKSAANTVRQLIQLVNRSKYYVSDGTITEGQMIEDLGHAVSDLAEFWNYE